MKSRVLILVVLVFALSVMGSGMLTRATDSGHTDPVLAAGATAAATTAAGSGYVRFINVSINVGAINVYLDTAKPTNLPVGKATDFIKVTAGTHSIILRKASVQKDPTDVGAGLLTSTTVDVAANTSLNIVAVGPVKDKDFVLDMFSTDRSATNGKARVEVYHGSSHAGTVDVTAGGKPVFSGLTYPGASKTSISVAAGKVDLAVANSDSGNVAINLPKTDLKADTIYTVVAYDSYDAVTGLTISPLVLTSKSVAGAVAPPAAATAPAAAATAPAAAATTAPAAATPAATAAATP